EDAFEIAVFEPDLGTSRVRETPAQLAHQTALQKLAAALQKEGEDSSNAPKFRRVLLSDEELSPRLDSGLLAVGVLKEIAESLRYLFRFAHSPGGKAERYLVHAHEEGFARDVKQLGDILEQVRRVPMISLSEKIRLRELYDKLSKELFDKGIVKTTLSQY